jgi:ubiquitin-protein ligase
MDREEFVDLNFRPNISFHELLRPEQLQEYVVPADIEFNVDFSEHRLFKQPRKLQKTLGTAGPTFREARIAEEFAIAREAGLHVYGTTKKGSNPENDLWQVFVRSSCVVKDINLWNLLVTFPGNYPYVPPVFRFLAIPPLVRVYRNGRVLFPDPDQYQPMMRVAELLKAIERLPLDTQAQWKGINQEKWLKRRYDRVRRVKPFPIREITDAHCQPWGLSEPEKVGNKAVVPCDDDFVIPQE